MGPLAVSQRSRKSKNELLTRRRSHGARSQPVGAMRVLREREPLRDSFVLREQLPHELRAVALATSMQQHDVFGKPARLSLAAIQNLLDRFEGLFVGEVPLPAGDAVFEEE